MIKEMNVLREYVQDIKKSLVPFTDEEMSLLSLNQVQVSKKKGIYPSIKGVFNTIYFEPLVAYAQKTFNDDQKLILITTSADEFIYLTKNNMTHVYFNHVEVGVLRKDGKLMNSAGKLMALVDGADHLPQHAVWIQGKEMGFIYNPKLTNLKVQRAFNLLQNMSLEERTIFLSLTLINLVEEAQ